MHLPIITTTGAIAAEPSSMYRRYKATAHSMGDAQISCSNVRLWQMFSVSVDISVTAPKLG